MQFLALVYIDPSLLDALPAGEADSMMRDCFAHADHLQAGGAVAQRRLLLCSKAGRRRQQDQAREGVRQRGVGPRSVHRLWLQSVSRRTARPNAPAAAPAPAHGVKRISITLPARMRCVWVRSQTNPCV